MPVLFGIQPTGYTNQSVVFIPYHILCMHYTSLQMIPLQRQKYSTVEKLSRQENSPLLKINYEYLAVDQSV
jgi:hypothetical protein